MEVLGKAHRQEGSEKMQVKLSNKTRTHWIIEVGRAKLGIFYWECFLRAIVIRVI